jgi:hypothetical protein
MSTAIAYSGGCYGTYLHWVLETLRSPGPIVPPFTDTGSSHLFANQGSVPAHLMPTVAKGDILRVHPKTLEGELLDINMDLICNRADNVVYLYPCQDTRLLVLNNYVSKIWQDWWSYQFEQEISARVIYDNWPVDPATPIDQISNWIKREFMSYFLIDGWLDQIEWDHNYTNQKCLTVRVGELLFNFVPTIEKIIKTINLESKKSIDELVPIHMEMLVRQRYLGHDQLAQSIIDSFTKDKDIEWNELGLTTEAWIQSEMRKLGLHIRCDGLDLFPTNSVTLKSLTYKANESI